MAPSTETAEAPTLGGRALAPAASSPAGRWPLVLGVVLLSELLATILDVRWGPWSVVGFEEGRNARAALQLACGHSDRLLDLQYRDFCGGCTGVAVLGAPLLRWFGATVGVWKMVPAAFHVGLVGLVAAALGRNQRWVGAVAGVLVLAASPWSLRELALTAWGNHAEVRTLLLLAVVLLLQRKRPLLTSVLAGACTGLSVWFAHIALHAVPALFALAATRRWRGLPFLLGLPAGLMPWVWFLQHKSTARDGATALWQQLHLARPVDVFGVLVGPLSPGSLWPSTGNAVLDGVLAASVALTVLLALAGVARGASRRDRLAWCTGLAVLGFVAALFLRADLWADVPQVPDASAFHVRYRAVLWPWVAIGVGLAVQHLPRAAVGLAVPLLVMGLGARTLAWTLGPGPTLQAPVWSDPGKPDATVPEGNPPRRNPWSLDRTVDITAARDFLDHHTDPLPACRQDHEGELGRRIGLHIRRGASPALPDQSTSNLAAGVAWGLSAPAGAQPKRPAGEVPPAWKPLVDRSLARLGKDVDSPEGRCLQLADAARSAATENGRRKPTSPAPPPPPECADPTAWSQALREVSREWQHCPLGDDWPTCDD